MTQAEIARINECLFADKMEYPKVVIHSVAKWRSLREHPLEDAFYDVATNTIHMSSRASLGVYLHELGHYIHVYGEGYEPDPIMALLYMDDGELYADEFVNFALAKLIRCRVIR